MYQAGPLPTKDNISTCSWETLQLHVQALQQWEQRLSKINCHLFSIYQPLLTDTHICHFPFLQFQLSCYLQYRGREKRRHGDYWHFPVRKMKAIENTTASIQHIMPKWCKPGVSRRLWAVGTQSRQSNTQMSLRMKRPLTSPQGRYLCTQRISFNWLVALRFGFWSKCTSRFSSEVPTSHPSLPPIYHKDFKLSCLDNYSFGCSCGQEEMLQQRLDSHNVNRRKVALSNIGSVPSFLPGILLTEVNLGKYMGNTLLDRCMQLLDGIIKLCRKCILYVRDIWIYILIMTHLCTFWKIKYFLWSLNSSCVSVKQRS